MFGIRKDLSLLWLLNFAAGAVGLAAMAPAPVFLLVSVLFNGLYLAHAQRSLSWRTRKTFQSARGTIAAFVIPTNTLAVAGMLAGLVAALPVLTVRDLGFSLLSLDTLDVTLMALGCALLAAAPLTWASLGLLRGLSSAEFYAELEQKFAHLLVPVEPSKASTSL